MRPYRYLFETIYHSASPLKSPFFPLTRSRRYQSSLASKFRDLVSKPSSKYQIYVSTSDDPIINLSIEHFILQSSHVESTVLFLYVNRPCVVIGRNQNPWLETNLRLLSNTSPADRDLGLPKVNSHEGSSVVELVRRRSGGGTVFHDHGNVNYSVTCPSEKFTRDKHAEMIVRAIRQDNPRARVNERHDIVLDQGGKLPVSQRPPDTNYHKSPYDQSAFLKVSGSAYKLIRNRALHHGTCLVNTPRVGHLGRYLRSPASPYIKARGVDSVRSPVGNVYPTNKRDAVAEFHMNAITAFTQMYNIDEALDERLWDLSHEPFLETFRGGLIGRLGRELSVIGSISEGIKEMNSLNWLYNQTPQFTFSTYPTDDDPRPRPLLPSYLPKSTRVFFKARHGIITEASISTSQSATEAGLEAESTQAILKGKSIQEIDSWKHVLDDASMRDRINKLHEVADWLDGLFGVKDLLPRE